MSATLALVILALGLMLLVGDHGGMVAGIDAPTFGYLVMGGALMVYIGGGLLSRYGGRTATMARDAVTWIALGLVLVTLYSYRDMLLPMAGRVAAELVPGSAMTVEDGSAGQANVRLRRRLDGHFVAKVDVNGASVPMIVDTGASTIVLRREDAARAGIDINELVYSEPVLTANGHTLAARVSLGDVAIGPLELRNVEALVAKPGGLSESLLGMTFLSRLRSYEFSGDFLTLRG